MIGKKALTTALTVGVAAHGISKGIRESGATDAFYEMTTGNPNIDEEVLGTNLGMSAFAPIPDIPIPFAGSIPMSNASAIRRGGFVGLTAAVNSGMMNSKMMTDHFRNYNRPLSNTYEPRLNQFNQPPFVDGSLVFALKNASFA